MTNWTYDHDGIIRGDVSQKKITLIFTGGEFGEGSTHILDTLKEMNIKAAFFVTGTFIRTEGYTAYLKRMVAEGHYLGPHSDSHPLYCPWDDREKTLVTEEFFRTDLEKNINDLKALGAMKNNQTIYFIPPFEWYNKDQVAWSEKMSLVLFNFTPGSGSNRDWAPESHKSFVPSQVIIDDILKYEQKDPNGLNGFLLLLHLGSGRKDPTFLLLKPLLEELTKRGYQFISIEEMLPYK